MPGSFRSPAFPYLMEFSDKPAVHRQGLPGDVGGALTKQEGRGSGLGLAVVRAIVDELGGGIQVTTAPGQGTTFTIDLPQAPAPGA